LRIDATVLGAGHLRKTGPGQMWLAAANTYNGLTTVAEGALSVLDPNGLGAAATGTTVQEGATLELNFVGTLPEPLALRGEGVSGQGALGVFGDVTLRNPLPSIYAPVDLTTDTIIGVAPNSFLVVDGFISGIGALRKRGPGTLRFGGNDHNTYVGDTYIDEGIFIMAKPTGTTAVPGALSIGTSAGLPAMAGNVASYQVIGNIFVNRGGLLNLNGQVENVDHLWLTEGGDVQTSTGILFLKAGGSIQVVPGAAGDLSMITGNLDLDAGDHVINVGASTSSGLASTVQLEISALITSSLGSINLQKQGPGILRLTANNTYTGLAVVNAGVLQLDGIQAGSSFQVQNGGELAGQGRAGSINFLASGNGSRAVAPGNAPGLGGGILRCGSFNSGGGGGVLRVDLLGATPGVGGYDRLHAIGRFANVRLDGVTLDARLHFASAVDNQFIIILNDGIFSLADDTPKPVIGEFVGLPEGTNFYIGGEQFTITYIGGDGNDVVLRRIPTPPRPALMIQQVSPASVRLLWPASFADYMLQSTTNLVSANWMAAFPLPLVNGTNNVVTNATGAEPRFYRLFKP
jgi:autotransporter-associated beta strand protein